ncbi:MAG: VOC family protein [Actinomycetota bacterium]|nr:VOC family protein [Actinomycetota bacterium]
MIDHIGVQTTDMEASKAFYQALLAPLGVQQLLDFGEAVGFAAADGNPRFWISKAPGEIHGENHIAFMAADRATVEAFHAAAVELGAEILHAPKEWPEYHPGYYGAFVRDLDGNNVEAVCHQ